jgi:hypothetical protein
VTGHRLTDGARRRAVRAIQSLVAAGIPDDEAREQVMAQFNVSNRSARKWLALAYHDMAAEVDVDRKQLLGTALRRRRLAMARSAKDGDWKTYLAAAESEARLLGLNAPVQTEHHVLIGKVADMSKAVVETIADFYGDDIETRRRFVQALQTRLNAQIARKPEPLALVIDGESEDVAQIEAGDVEPVEASEARPVDDIPTGPAPAPDAPPDA